MNNDDASIEQSLRALKWRAPSDAVLEASLKAALAERASLAGGRQKRVLDFIPHAVRWPLAACWTASLIFWWLTPRAAPSFAAAGMRDESPADADRMMAQKKATRELTHELLLAIENHGQHY